MKEKYRNILAKYFGFTLLVLSGFLAGYLVFNGSARRHYNLSYNTHVSNEDLWTCAMHPQIRMNEPGKCPICGMELIPVKRFESDRDPNSITISAEAAALASIATSKVSDNLPFKKIRMNGKLQYDERLLRSQVAYIPGRIEKLYVNYTGESIKRGRPIAQVYSPEFIIAGQELLEAFDSRNSQPEIYEAAREKLLQWKISESQIGEILETGKVKEKFDIVATTDGIVTTKNVREGDYIGQGSVLFEVADLSRMWVQFDAYENDLEYLVTGSHVEFNVEALPGRSFTGIITFVDPFIDPVTRVAKARVEVPNNDLALKPGMFATGTAEVSLKGRYSGKLVIPKSAVLWTGKRSIVYVRSRNSPDREYKMRIVELGPVAGDNYIVDSGLTTGEEIVTNGTFSLDAQSQLEGKPSMMNNSESATEPFVINEFRAAGNCDLCRERIEKAALNITGVISAKWDVKTRKIKVTYNTIKTDLNEIEKAIAGAGHDTELFNADDVKYMALPECCHYRK